ncbi:hypothetical protein SUGI_0109180 [Cryptomeria japonica]|uniref:uncharacterized protein LOC131070761 n=1 Tax=Cryptomeria japonica TaxID=3369 RepID=UPI002408B0C4|nr:uncharacterized protein LOC131070761 [Cryptomeria japonica]GLJ09418.1 hypothetical protein SUGI_0109180 [Cryptomeria japonica]
MVSMVAMKGHPGSGKSSIAQSLAKSLKWALLDKDDVRDSTLPLQSLVASALNDLSYAVVWRMADTQLKCGTSIIVDSPLSRPHLFQEAAALAAQHGARLLIVECRAGNEEEWRRRLEDRAQRSPSWHKPHSWEALMNLVEGYSGCCDYDTPQAKKLVVNTTCNLEREALNDRVLDWVRRADMATPAVTFLP